MPTLPLQTDRLRISDLVKWEVNSLFCRDSVKVKNTNAAALPAGGLTLGTPLVNNAGVWETAQTTQENTIDGIFLGNDSDRISEALAAGATTAGYYQILIRGPALINKAILPSTDGDGGALVLATMLTTLAALNILPLTEPAAAATTEQTT